MPSGSEIVQLNRTAFAIFIVQHDSTCRLTPNGGDAHILLLKVGTLDKLTQFQKRRVGAILGNSFLWSMAIVVAVYLEIEMILTAMI